MNCFITAQLRFLLVFDHLLDEFWGDVGSKRVFQKPFILVHNQKGIGEDAKLGQYHGKCGPHHFPHDPAAHKLTIGKYHPTQRPGSQDSKTPEWFFWITADYPHQDSKQ